MNRKAKEYSHVFELGVNLANVYASQSAFIYEHLNKFKFGDKPLTDYRNTFINDEKRGIYLRQNKNILDISCDGKSAISCEEMKLYYALSFLNPLMEVILSSSDHFEDFSLMLFSRYYEVFSTKSSSFNMSMIGNAVYLREFMDSVYSEFLSSPKKTLEVDYRFKSKSGTNAITCSAKYFNKTNENLDLASTIGISLENVTKDLGKEEFYIIRNWKGPEISEFAEKHIFTFVFDIDTSEFVILPLKSLELLGFNAISQMAASQYDKNIFSHLRVYTFDSCNPAVRALYDNIKDSDKGQFHINLNSMDYVFIYQKLTFGDWVLFTAIPYSIFLEPAIEGEKNNAKCRI